MSGEALVHACVRVCVCCMHLTLIASGVACCLLSIRSSSVFGWMYTVDERGENGLRGEPEANDIALVVIC